MLERYDKSIFEINEVRLELSLHLDHVLLQSLLIRSETDSKELYFIRIKLNLMLLDLYVELILDAVLNVQLVIKGLTYLIFLL